MNYMVNMRTVFPNLIRYDDNAKQDIDFILETLHKYNLFNYDGKTFYKFWKDTK